MKPGLQRAIPATIFAFLLSSAVVYIIRLLQQMEPVYDSSVTLVLAPFVMIFAFIWGMGGLDPRMSEHAHGPQESDGVAIVPVAESHDDHHDPYEEVAQKRPLTILTAQIWTIGTIVLVLVLGLLAFAQLPTGLRLEQSNDPFASVSQNATNATFATPFGLGPGQFEASELTVFLGFIAFTMISLLVTAGLLGLVFYGLNQGVASVRTVKATSIDDPENQATFTGRAAHAPLRLMRAGLNGFGRGAGWTARRLKRGLPAFFGQK